MLKKLVLVLLLTGFLNSYAELPDSTRITYKIPARVKVSPAFATPVTKNPTVSRTNLSDSMQLAIMDLSYKRDSLISISQEQEGQLRSMEAQMRQLAEENKNLSNELENANGDKLQSSHTNSILYIFSVLLGIILLIALVWMLGKKKTREPEVIPVNGYAGNGTHETFSQIAPVLDHRLERIEKLGNLRGKGLLTEEEFNLQKKQILEERS